MVTSGKLLRAGRVATALARILGPGRQWIDFLNDCRQERTAGVFGEVIYPIGYEGGDPDRAGAPRYHPRDLADFIARVQTKAGTSRPFEAAIEVYTYDDAPGLGPASWRSRRVTRVSPAPAASGRAAAPPKGVASL